MASPEKTPGMTRIGKRWKVQAYLSEEAAQAIAEQAAVCDEAVGSIISAIIDKVAAGRNPAPTEKIIAAIKGAAQARKRK